MPMIVDTESSSRVRRLPMIVAGRRVQDSTNGVYEFESRTGARVTIPRLSESVVQKLCEQDRMQLAGLPLQEVLSFINRVGKNWRSPEYTRRRLYVQQLQEVLGYSEAAADAEADRIAILLNSHARMYDVIEAELGSRFIVDGWVRREEAEVKAIPRGLVLHILPGNVPLASVLSLLRALITKNISIAKVGSTDPLTVVALAQSFMEVDPDHPVTRGTSVVYWEKGSAEALHITHEADAICAWGGAEAIRFARQHANDDAPVIPFGPKHSFALIDATTDPQKSAQRLAHDVAVYDQQACFSIRRVFVRGPIDSFVRELRIAMDRYSELLPSAQLSLDRAAQVQLSHKLDTFLGRDVEASAGAGWSLVVCPAPWDDTEHPLGRKLYLHPVESFSEAYRFAEPRIQTVAASPWPILREHRDELAKRGVSRFVELGLVHLFRIGGAHDGVNPLQGLVRFASAEAPGSVFGKGVVLELDETAMLEAGTLKDLVL